MAIKKNVRSDAMIATSYVFFVIIRKFKAMFIASYHGMVFNLFRTLPLRGYVQENECEFFFRGSHYQLELLLAFSGDFIESRLFALVPL